MHRRHLSAHRHMVARRDFWRTLRPCCCLALLLPVVKTVTITEAKKHLGAYLKDAVDGANIGIICGNRIVALRPVEVTSMDFDTVGDTDTDKLTAEQKDRLYAQLKKERKEAKRRRKELLGSVEP
jgi:hypothetical protein